jgi:hypothetical protein
MRFAIQLVIFFASLAGLIVLTVAVWYGVSFLFLALVSRLLPLTGRRKR